MEIIQSAQNLIAKIPLAVFDYIFIICFILYVYEEVTLGAKAALSHAAAIIGAFLVGLFTYSYLSKLLIFAFSRSKGVSDAIAFFLIAAVTYIILSRLIFYLSKQVSDILPKKFSKPVAFAAGTVSFIFIVSFIIAVFLSFPVAIPIKYGIKNSLVGNYLLTKTQNVELAVKQVFGDTIEESLNFLTVKPDSDGSVPLHFTTEKVSVDRLSETQMLNLLNKARKNAGVKPVEEDVRLRNAARQHGRDMFKKGYFSHYTPEGYTPFDRLSNLDIPYTAAAENLAYAPEVDLAFSGLMKSEGHRRNILDPTFNKVGIGVIDGGIYGKMFVQEFSD